MQLISSEVRKALSRAILETMDQNITALERAFQIAKSGECETLTDVKKRLKAEGYSINQIEGRTITKQLATLIKNAKADPTATPGTAGV